MNVWGVAAMVLLGASLGVPGAQEKVPALALAQAETRWLTRQPQAYEFKISVMGAWARSGAAFRVIEGKAQPPRDSSRALQSLHETHGTVEKLFAVIRRTLATGDSRVSVRYDREYGYPIWADLDPHRNVIDDERFFRVTGFRSLDGVVAVGQGASDRSKSPILDPSAGGFTVRRLSGPVAIDGRTWLAVEPTFGTQTLRARNGEFTLSPTDATDEGDVGRFRLAFVERGGKPVTLTADPVSYAYMTDDSRWIVFEPVEVIDVRAWRRYSLGKVFGISPYVVPIAISADGRRLVIRRSVCPFDCRDFPDEFYEIGFPAARE